MLKFPMIAMICASGAAVISIASLTGQTDAHQMRTQALGLRCEVVTRDLGDAVEIAGKVTSDRKVRGDYTLHIRNVSDQGDALIDQSGAFSVGAGRTKTLGQATLGGAPGHYDADLTLTIDGARVTCLGTGADIEI
ncbi:MAG: curli-like amyloid fiber formation chaperone CsgH [Pseudomonadota bacterium]